MEREREGDRDRGIDRGIDRWTERDRQMRDIDEIQIYR